MIGMFINDWETHFVLHTEIYTCIIGCKKRRKILSIVLNYSHMYDLFDSLCLYGNVIKYSTCHHDPDSLQIVGTLCQALVLWKVSKYVFFLNYHKIT